MVVGTKTVTRPSAPVIEDGKDGIPVMDMDVEVIVLLLTLGKLGVALAREKELVEKAAEEEDAEDEVG